MFTRAVHKVSRLNVFYLFQKNPLAEGLCALCMHIFYLVSQKLAGLYNAPFSHTVSCGVFVYVCQKQKIFENMEQRICINFCFKLSKTGTETNEMMNARDEAMNRARVFE